MQIRAETDSDPHQREPPKRITFVPSLLVTGGPAQLENIFCGYKLWQ